MQAKTVLVTGGAGFIGSALIRHLINHTQAFVINVDMLTYAGDVQRLVEVSAHPRYHFEHVDIQAGEVVLHLLKKYQPELVMHLAAETHVDRSITNPEPFIISNILGTYTLLEQVRIYYDALPTPKRQRFRFHHISTDEVYGDLTMQQAAATEHAPYLPRACGQLSQMIAAAR